MEPLLIGPEEAFEMLGIKHAKGYQMIMKGELPSIKIGRSRRIPVAQLRAWIDARVAEECPQFSIQGEEAPDGADGQSSQLEATAARGGGGTGAIRVTGHARDRRDYTN